MGGTVIEPNVAQDAKAMELIDGFHLVIDALKLNCRTDQGQQPVNTLEINQNYPYTGYLLGTNDVIYVYVWQPGGYEMTLNLWPLDAGTDFEHPLVTKVEP